MSDDDDEENANDRMDRAERIRRGRENRGTQERGGDSNVELEGARSGTDDDVSDESRSTDDGDASGTDQHSQQSMTSQTSQRDQRDQTSQNESRAESRPVKERPHRTVYLPRPLDDELERTIDEIMFHAKHEGGVTLGKNRHVYPLVMYVGVERAQEMDIDELLATLRDEELLDSPDAE